VYLPSGYYDNFTMCYSTAGSHVLEVVSILLSHCSECLHEIENKILGGNFFLVSGAWKLTYAWISGLYCMFQQW